LHVLMTDGAFRRDGTFVPLPVPEPAVLEELWRRSVLGEFVRHGWLEEDAAAGMMSWPHSGFGAYVGPRIEEREGLLRVARYRARAPVAGSRLRDAAERAEVALAADRNDGPYAGVRGRGTDPRVRDRAGGDPAHPGSARAARGGRPGRTVGGSGGGSGLRARAWCVGEGRAPEGEREWARPRWGECAPGARGGGL